MSQGWRCTVVLLLSVGWLGTGRQMPGSYLSMHHGWDCSLRRHSLMAFALSQPARIFSLDWCRQTDGDQDWNWA
jgi:hypothetical protein